MTVTGCVDCVDVGLGVTLGLTPHFRVRGSGVDNQCGVNLDLT